MNVPHPPTPIRATIWSEDLETHDDGAARANYPRGIEEAIAAGVGDLLAGVAVVRTASLKQPDQGLPAEALERTDVLVWWGHRSQELVADDLVDRLQDRVLGGMGLVVLHSAAQSRVFRRLTGTTGTLRWRQPGERELVWTIAPGHPVARGIPEVFAIPRQEVYGEPFDIPPPDELVFISSFTGGEVFRSGCCFRRGAGRIFYFGPGDEEYPVYHQPEVLRVIANAILWAAPTSGVLAGPRRSQRVDPIGD